MTYESIYIYGIINGKHNTTFNVSGIGERGDKVYSIPHKDITAVVSNTPFEEYDPTEDNTLAHENVIQEVIAQGFDIAPMRFCTILKNKEEIFKLCSSCYMPFKKNIFKIKGKQEFSVKTFLLLEKVQAEVKSDEEILEQSRLMATALYDMLKEIAFDDALEEQSTREMIFNCSFLVKKDDVKPFYDAIQAFDAKYTNKIKIRISGPTAPYNFVDMPTEPI